MVYSILVSGCKCKKKPFDKVHLKRNSTEKIGG
jgi:hypothetical protein